MAASDTNRINDLMPFAPITGPAAIHPLAAPPAQDELGTSFIGELGGPLPFGCDRPEPGPEQRA